MNNISKKIFSFFLISSMLLTFSQAFADKPTKDSPTIKVIDTIDIKTYNDDFKIVPYGSKSWNISNSTVANGTFTFDDRAKGIRIIFKDTTNNKVIYSHKFINAGPKDSDNNPQGIKKIIFAMQMSKAKTYKLTFLYTLKHPIKIYPVF